MRDPGSHSPWVDQIDGCGRIARVRGDSLGIYRANEQGTPVKLRDGPAAVCRWRFLNGIASVAPSLEEPLLAMLTR